jgi:hypothetical protein
MKNSSQTQQKSQTPTDFFGAFCFVVLITTVAYASITAV